MIRWMEPRPLLRCEIESNLYYSPSSTGTYASDCRGYLRKTSRCNTFTLEKGLYIQCSVEAKQCKLDLKCLYCIMYVMIQKMHFITSKNYIDDKYKRNLANIRSEVRNEWRVHGILVECGRYS